MKAPWMAVIALVFAPVAAGCADASEGSSSADVVAGSRPPSALTSADSVECTAGDLKIAAVFDAAGAAEVKVAAKTKDGKTFTGTIRPAGQMLSYQKREVPDPTGGSTRVKLFAGDDALWVVIDVGANSDEDFGTLTANIDGEVITRSVEGEACIFGR